MNLPNKLTMARVIAVPFFCAAYMTGHFVVALVLFCLASLTDMLDGKIARKYNLITNFGKIMDPLADKILVYAAMVLMVSDSSYDSIAAWMLIVILAREFLIAGMRTVAASEGIVIAASMSGKIKTVLQMVAVILFLLNLSVGRIELSGFSNPHILDWATYFGAKISLRAALIATVWSGIEYVAKNKEVFRQ